MGVKRVRKLREMCDVLRDDLYKRVPSGNREEATWENPGGLRCIYGYSGEGSVYCALIDSRGAQYAFTDDADADWLIGEML